MLMILNAEIPRDHTSALVSMDLNLSMGRVSTLMSVIAGSVAKFVLTQLAATNARVKTAML